jgi:hypothetical protein
VGWFWKQPGSSERKFTIKRACLQWQSGVLYTVKWRPQLLFAVKWWARLLK